MMLRPEGEAPSDFQDYTLVAVIAVAAHLTRTPAGPHSSLAALAHTFLQDPTALHQVCCCPHSMLMQTPLCTETRPSA